MDLLNAFHSNNNHLLCKAWASPCYRQIICYSNKYLWHIFSAIPYHQGTANKDQIYHFWHEMSFISSSLEMCSTSPCRPVLWEEKDIRVLVYLKQQHCGVTSAARFRMCPHAGKTKAAGCPERSQFRSIAEADGQVIHATIFCRVSRPLQ